jgi:hypothetical protein
VNVDRLCQVVGECRCMPLTCGAVAGSEQTAEDGRALTQPCALVDVVLASNG